VNLMFSKVVIAVLALALIASDAVAQELDQFNEDLQSYGLTWLSPLDKCPFNIIPDSSDAISKDLETCEQHLSKCVDECRLGNAERCFSAAETHEALRNEARAHALYAQSCKLGVSLGCTNYAARLRYREQGDDVCIANTFFEMCSRNDIWGCAMSSVVSWQAEGVTQDAAKAESYAEKACNIDTEHDACLLAQDILSEVRQPEFSE